MRAKTSLSLRLPLHTPRHTPQKCTISNKKPFLEYSVNMYKYIHIWTYTSSFFKFGKIKV